MRRIPLQTARTDIEQRDAATSGARDRGHFRPWIAALALLAAQAAACQGGDSQASDGETSAGTTNSDGGSTGAADGTTGGSSTGAVDDPTSGGSMSAADGTTGGGSTGETDGTTGGGSTGETDGATGGGSTGDSGEPPDDDTGIDATVCECTQEILPDQASVDVSMLAPGSVLCLRATTAAERGPLELKGFAGTASKPIVVRNCDGAVRIDGGASKPALRVPTGSHFRITGAGAEGVEHGIVLSAPDAPQALLLLHVTDAEIDHLEVDASNFAAIMSKVDPSSSDCKVGDRRFDSFVMQGISIHHNHLHNVAGEGIYLGNSFYRGDSTNYCGKNANCDFVPCGGVQYPHEVRGVRIYKNVIEATGWDGIQVGSAVADCLVEQNVVRDWGTEKTSGQNHGIQVGDGSSCTVRRNLLVNGGVGMQIAGIGGSVVHDNVIVGNEGFGVYVNPRPTPLSTDVVDQGYVGGFVVAQNTVITAPTQQGAVLRDVNVPNNPVPSDNRLADNLVVSLDSGYLQLTPSYNWAVEANLRFATTAEAGLSGAGAENFCPDEGSEPVGGGVDLGALGLTSDFLGGPRPVGSGWDVGAVECH